MFESTVNPVTKHLKMCTVVQGAKRARALQEVSTTPLENTASAVVFSKQTFRDSYKCKKIFFQNIRIVMSLICGLGEKCILGPGVFENYFKKSMSLL